MIGSYGDIVFEVSSERVKTFRDFQIQRSAKYSEHAIHGRKALLEFTGLSPASLSINIRLDAGLGLNPKEELNMLYEVLNNHITMIREKIFFQQYKSMNKIITVIKTVWEKIFCFFVAINLRT